MFDRDILGLQMLHAGKATVIVHLGFPINKLFDRTLSDTLAALFVTLT